MYKRQILAVLCVVIGLQACYKDTNNEDIILIPDDPQIEVESHVAAVAVDLSGNRISGVATYLNQQISQTDLNGYADLQLDFVELDREILKFSKSGYFSSSQSIPAFAGATSLMSFPLIAVEHSQEFPSSNNAVFVINDQLEIELGPNNLFQTSTGDAYSGAFRIEGKRLNNLESQFFYNLRTPLLFSEEQKSQIIIPRTTVLVNFKSLSGEELQITEPCQVSVITSMPNENESVFILNDSGTFERTEYTYEDGRITIQSAVNSILVVGEVKDAKLLSGKLNTTSLHRLDNVRIEIDQQQHGIKYTSSTSSEGDYRIWVVDDLFHLKLSSLCGHVIHESRFDPHKLSGDIDIDLNGDDFFTYNGQVLKCDQAPVTSGYLISEGSHGSWLTPISYSGNFSALVPYCIEEQVQVNCYDFKAGEKVQSFNLLTSSSSNNNIIYACPNEENTEASVFIESDIVFFNQCDGEAFVSDANLKGLTFTVANDQMDEVHRFVRNMQGKQDFWYSPSQILDDQFKIITIGGQPNVTSYEFQGISYREVIFSSVLFEDIATGDRSRGSLQYIMVGK